MLQALTNGLDDVAKVTPDYKAATRSDHEGAIRLDKLDIPQPDQGLETGINDVEIALGELGAANQDYQVVQLKDDLRTIAKEDDKAEARLKDIETTKQLLSNVGGMIDQTVGVMNGAGSAIAAGADRVHVGEAKLAVYAQRLDMMDDGKTQFATQYVSFDKEGTPEIHDATTGDSSNTY